MSHIYSIQEDPPKPKIPLCQISNEDIAFPITFNEVPQKLSSFACVSKVVYWR